MAIELTDDGTMDTVLRCSDCGEEIRYSSPDDVEEIPRDDTGKYRVANLRYTSLEQAEIALREQWIAEIIDEATEEHECAEAEEPQEDDITTTNHEKFYQNGRLVLEQSRTMTVAPGTTSEQLDTWFYYDNGRRLLGTFGDNHVAALRAYMERTQWFPNVWFISDHGNAHLMDLTEGK